MKIIRLTIPLLFATIIAFSQPDVIRKIDEACVQLNRQGMFNGVVLIAEKGKVTYQRNFGVANHATGQALTQSSSFNLASVTKQFVTMMTMMLMEQGKLKYDDPVTRFIPELPYPGITIRHLMTHTSGLPEYFDLGMAYMGPMDTLTNDKLIRLLHDVKPPLDFETGSRWSYCNTGYALLASVIERASGQQLDQFFRQQITTPLGMKNTLLYSLALKNVTIPQRVYGFRRTNGKIVPEDLMRFDGVWGDGNVYSSAEDLLKWDQALYGSKLIKPATLAEAFKPVQLNNGTTYPYGFAWGISNDGKTVSHTGSWGGFRNLIRRDIDKKRTLIILSSGGNGTIRNIADNILDGKPYQVPVTKIITNVMLVDGTGTAPRKAAVRILGERILEVGELTPFQNEEVTDGRGLTLAPGFIDTHSHHDWGMSEHPDLIAASSQGITTIVVGQDGGGRPIDSIAASLRRQPIAVNLATYTGHTMLRAANMGVGGLLRRSTPEELEKMKTMLHSEMEKGSLGLATGLEYENAFFSNRREVIELAKVASSHKGRYISHIRSEDINLEEAVDEIIEIGRITGMPVQIGHMKIAMKSKWGNSAQLLNWLQQARASGVNITADVYPYDFWMSTIRVLFPKRDYTNLESARYATNELFDPSKSVLAAFAPNPEYAGKTVGEVALMRKEDTATTLMYLVAAAEKFEATKKDPNIDVEGIMAKSMDDVDVERFISWPHSNICSDGAIDGHPRGHGAFTRVLGRYVRERKIITLEEAVYKMTGLAAEHLGIADRGTISPTNFADLVLFDPSTVSDKSTVQNPKALSTGIEAVWVNGQLVFKAGAATGSRPGTFVRRVSPGN